MLTRIILVLLLSSLAQASRAQIRIRLFYAHNSESTIIRVKDNDHELFVNGRKKSDLHDGDMILVLRAGDKVVVNIRTQSGILADSVNIYCKTDSGSLNLTVPKPEIVRYEYEGDLTFSSSLGQLKIINTLDIDSYIEGVVQAEGGYKGHNEYMKSQAVIARTYAYLHKGKHADEGYDLCDDVHCQAYHGRSITETINSSVRETSGQILTDSDSILILTPFHSNCGGETVSSEYVWLSAKPYLVSVFDPYCGFSRNALWEKDIKRSDWVKYLENLGDISIRTDSSFSLVQNSRIHRYKYRQIDVPLTTIRTDWAFRSTFFSIKDDGDILHFSGRGYGHGVGFCQEGAMVMATRGFTYRQILNFYFNKVLLLNIDIAKREEKVDLSF